MTIRAAYYDETERRLTDDQIVIDMAASLTRTSRDQMTHDDGTPRFEFMQAANRVYAERGGKDNGHIGAVAHALLALLALLDAK